MIIMLIKADNTTVLAPDYSWVPANLGRFIGGIQAICIVVLVVTVIAGVLRFVLARVTTTRVDDAIGDRVLISVIVACFFIAGLGQLVGDQMGAWNTDVSSNSAMVYGTNSSSGVGEDTSNLIEQITKHGIANGVSRTVKAWGKSAKDAAGKIAQGAKKGWDSLVGWAQDRGRDIGNAGRDALDAIYDFFHKPTDKK